MCPITLGTGSPKTVPQVLHALHRAQEVPTQRLKRCVPHRVPNTTLQALCALHHARHKRSQHSASSVMCLTGCPIQRYKYCVPYTMLGTRTPNTTYTMLGTRSLNIGTTIYHLPFTYTMLGTRSLNIGTTIYHLTSTIYHLRSTIYRLPC